MTVNARRPVSALVAAAFAFVVVIAVWHSFGGLWTTVGTERLQYRGMTLQGRVQASTWGLADVRVLQFWKDRLRKGDRYYLNSPATTPTVPSWLALLGLISNYYLVPAERVLEARNATVILSWNLPPRRAGVPLAATTKLAGADVSISRVTP
jgi:hypothetical protein